VIKRTKLQQQSTFRHLQWWTPYNMIKKSIHHNIYYYFDSCLMSTSTGTYQYITLLQPHMPTYWLSVAKTSSTHTGTIIGDLYVYKQRCKQSHLLVLVSYLTDLSNIKYKVCMYITMQFAPGEAFEDFGDSLDWLCDNCSYKCILGTHFKKLSVGIERGKQYRAIGDLVAVLNIINIVLIILINHHYNTL